MHYFLLGCLLLLSPLLDESASAQTFENGWLEKVEGQRILHLKGAPYQIGYQHGLLLKNEIAGSLKRYIEPILSSNEIQLPVIARFMEALPKMILHIPEALMDEMHGIADASQQPFANILLLNLFPEMFHCTGITVSGDATANGELYHVRVLDYSQGNGLQHAAVLTIVEPDDGKPFLNVTYAGFVGCVTGMNIDKIAMGEIGGKGYGYWDGIPMAFLLRTVLQYASSLEDAKKFLETAKRTCEYYYVFSDGKTGESLGCYATYDKLSFFAPGESYCKFPAVQNRFDPPQTSPNYDAAFLRDRTYDQPKDILMISRWDHFDILKNRLLSKYGSLGVNELKEAIKHPVAHPTNLHNAIFAPETLDVWISHAGKKNEPAYNEPYFHFNLIELLGPSWQSP